MDDDKLCVLVDTREQRPYRFVKYSASVYPATLTTGDYSVLGATNLIAVERKSLMDFWGSIGKGRERFFAEVRRLSKIPHSVIVVESTFEAATTPQMARRKFSMLSPAQVNAAIASIWGRKRVPIAFTGCRANSEEFVYRFLKAAYQKLKTYGGWLEPNRRRTAETFTCHKCGLTKHEDLDNLRDWRTAMHKDGRVFVVCSTCRCAAKAPEGFRWSRGRGLR